MSRLTLVAMAAGFGALACANQTRWAPDASSAKARPLLVATEPPAPPKAQPAPTPSAAVEPPGPYPGCIPTSLGSVSSTPRVRFGMMTVSGDIPREVVSRVVRQNFVRFRTCYEQALERKPGASGIVATRFVIARDGSITELRDVDSDLPDRAMIDCVLAAYSDLSFPQPADGGVVDVAMPMLFCPPLAQPIEPPPEPEEPE